MSAEKISEHIFAPTRGCCIHYPQSIILFTYQVGILIDFVPNFKKVNHTGYVGENFDILCSPPKLTYWSPHTWLKQLQLRQTNISEDDISLAGLSKTYASPIHGEFSEKL